MTDKPAPSQKPRKSTSAGTGSNTTEARKSLRPLAPKASAPAVSSTLTIRGRKRSPPFRQRPPAPRCSVCFQAGCALISHKQFSSESRPASGRTSTTTDEPDEDPRDTQFTLSYAYRLGRQHIAENFSVSGSYPRCNLPVADHLNTPEMHRLFYEWFLLEGPRAFAVPRPKEVVTDLVYSPFMAPALVDNALCLSVLAVAAASKSIAASGPSSKVQALTLMGHAMESVREQLNVDPEHVPDFTIAAATFLWFVNFYLEDHEAMRQHGTGVRTFVDARGGLQHLGMSGVLAVLIRWADIHNSVILCEPCHFHVTLEEGVVIEPSDRSCGTLLTSSLTSMNNVLDPAVLEGCLESHGLMQVLEDSQRKGITSAEYWFIMQRLATICTKASVRRSRYEGSGNLNECVGLAEDLVRTATFCGSTKQRFCATALGPRMVKAIKSAGSPIDWQTRANLLIWILFAVLLIEGNELTKQGAFCQSTLREVLEAKVGHNAGWEEDRRQQVRKVLQQFVWSDFLLGERTESIFAALSSTGQ